MKKLAVLAFLLSAVPAWAQYWGELHTNAPVPPREVLESPNLQLACSSNLPTGGRKTGLCSFHIFEDQFFLPSLRGMGTSR